MNKKILIIAAIFVGIIIIVIVSLVVVKNSAPQPGIVKDRDTGNTASVGRTGDLSGSALVVFGENNLYKHGISKDQFKNIHDTLAAYSVDRLTPLIQSVTIRPQDLVQSDTLITTTLRIGQTDTLLPLSMKFDQKGGVVILIKDPQILYRGTYVGVSGLPYSDLTHVKVDPVSYKNNSIEDTITLSIDAPEGYRNGAIEKLNELGHTVGAFTYLFTNYKSPF